MKFSKFGFWIDDKNFVFESSLTKCERLSLDDYYQQHICRRCGGTGYDSCEPRGYNGIICFDPCPLCGGQGYELGI